MTTPRNDGADASDPTAQPVSFEKPATEQPFDPYRFGAPEHPIPPEYAPPGYRPPPPTQPPAATQQPQAYPGYAGGPYANQPYADQPYPGQQYPYPAPYATQYPPPKTGNGKAIAGLVLGILAIIFCWTSFLDFAVVALGLVFGILGVGEAKRTGSGRGMAMTGVVLALVGALLATVVTVVIYQRIKPCLNDYAQNSVAYDQCIRDQF